MKETIKKQIRKVIPKLVKSTVAAIIIKDNKILLEKRSAFIEKDKWCLPGGHIEFGEKATNALQREVREELGLDTREIKFLSYFDEIIPKIKNHPIVLVYKTKVSGKFNLQQSEVSEIDWFTKKEIQKLNMAFKHKGLINKFAELK